jgi:hypothetical protein
VRLPVVFSILAHAALLIIALRLPARGLTRAPRTIDVDIRPAVRIPPPPPPVARPVEPLKPTQKPIVKERPRPQTEAPKPVEPPKPAEPPKSEPPPVAQPQQPQQKSSLSMRPTAPVDLNLHGLSGVIVQPGGKLQGGEGGAQGTLAANTPRKPPKKYGDAGDPLLGKLPEEKQERFPLTLEGDGYHYSGPSFSAKIAMDGRVTFEDHAIRDFKGLSGGFDLTDIAMKAKKQDPYRYEKEKFMELTSKLRGDLTTKARRDRLESSLAGLPEHLEQIWGDLSRPAIDRRRMLFAMWKDAAGSDEELGPAAKKARTTIEGFIRDRLPEGSTDSFTDEELRRFNVRTGAVKFDPYKTN